MYSTLLVANYGNSCLETVAYQGALQQQKSDCCLPGCVRVLEGMRRVVELRSRSSACESGVPGELGAALTV